MTDKTLRRITYITILVIAGAFVVAANMAMLYFIIKHT